MQQLYFAQCGDQIKIGVATDVSARMSSLQVGSAQPIKLLAAVKGDIHLERKLHKRLKGHLVRGEWFKDCEEVRAAIDETISIGDVADCLPARKTKETKFGKVAKVLWPLKTAAQLAAIANTNERTASRWLSGEYDPPICIVLAVMSETFGRPR